YVVKGDIIFTPPLSSGCLEGVTRGVLFEIAGEAGVGGKEQGLRPGGLYGAGEGFISLTNRKVIGVGEIAGNALAGAPGPVTKRVDEAFEAYVKEYVGRRRAAAR